MPHFFFGIFIVIVLILSGCGSSEYSSSTSSQEKELIASEQLLHHNAFSSTTEDWRIFYEGACAVSHSTTESFGAGGSLFVSARAHNYDGPSLDISDTLEASKLYIIRAYVKSITSDNYQLMAKISSETPEYIQLNRVAVASGEWTKLRAFVLFSQEQIDAGVSIYVNSDEAYDFFLDEVSISETTYDPTRDESASILRISGTEIRNTQDKVLQIKGINIIAYDDEDNSTNDTSAQKFMNYSYYNYDKSDFANIASMGFNAVRISLWYRTFEDESNPYLYKEEGFAWLNTILAWAKEANLYVMLDMHAPQGGGFQGPSNVTPFWSNSDYRTRFKALWREIATRYKNDATILAYDLINEPCAPSQADYITLLNETISIIREVDSRHIINVENSFASDSTLFTLPLLQNILYDFHYYDPWDSYTDNTSSVYGESGIDQAQMQTLFSEYTDFYNSNGVAFMVSEFGQKRDTFVAKNALDWVSDCIDLILLNNGNYFYFSYKGNEFSIYGSQNSFWENSTETNSALIELFKTK